MATILLQASRGGGVGLPLIILLVLVLWLFVKLMNKFTFTKRITFIWNMRRRGADSFVTVSSLTVLLTDILKRDGVKVKEISIVHEFGNRYQASVTIQDGKAHSLNVTADGNGTVMYQLV